jgi:hypothetical protein
MVKTVCRSFPWASPQYIDGMFMDAKDHHGLIYWYNDVYDQHREVKALTTPTK